MSIYLGELASAATRIRVLMAILAAFALPANANANANDFAVTVQDVQSSRTLAEVVLAVLDRTPLTSADLGNLIQQSGAALRTRYSASQFDARLRATRGRLGAMEHRSFSGFSGGFLSLPNIIAGEYVIVGFHTKFSGSATEYTEQVTLEKDREGSGVWRLVEYYTAPLQ